MSPADSESQVADFLVFKRRKKTNTQEESLEEKGSQEQTILVLTCFPTISFAHIEETTVSRGFCFSGCSTTKYFSRYKEIKRKNEALKVTTFSKFWKQTSTTQHKLLSALDSQKGQFQLAFLEPTVLVPKSAEDYKTLSLLLTPRRFMQLIRLTCINKLVRSYIQH